jgi:hypothetical protein
VHLFFRDDISQPVIEFDREESKHIINSVAASQGKYYSITMEKETLLKR